jgi:hypothetical protein
MPTTDHSAPSLYPKTCVPAELKSAQYPDKTEPFINTDILMWLGSRLDDIWHAQLCHTI